MPTRPGSQCPSVMELEAFLTHSGGDERIAQHLETCSRCRAALDEIQANNELMAGLAGSSITPQHVDSQSGPPPTVQITPAIEGYEVHGEIHRGGQGVVYRATQRATNRTVALKVLTAGVLATSQQRRRFEREIDLVAQLQHPNIVTLYDSGQTRDGCHYFAMQYVEGVPLDDYARSQSGRSSAGRSESVKDLLKLFSQVCAAVTYAHQRGVVHRDLKPGNIRVDAEGRPHVLDFGLAKTLETDAAQSRLTVTDAFLGTPAYASPEQTRGIPSLIDTRTDVYSLGVILYEMLTGHFPYPVVGTPAQVLKNIAEVEPERPSLWHRRDREAGESPDSGSLTYRVDAELETIVLKALAKEPPRRYQSADELRRDIEHYLSGEPIAARPPSAAYQLRKFAQRNKALVGGVAAVIVVLVLGVIGTSIGLARAVVAREGEKHQREVAETERDRARDAEELAAQRLVEAVRARSAEAEGRRRAEAEAAKAEAVNRFLRNMLAAASPEQTRGHEVTVVEVLDQAALQVESGSLADQPEVEAAVRNTIGRTYVALGSYPAAEPHLLRALEIRQQLHGDEHAEAATSLNNLGGLYHRLGRYDQATELCARALAMRRRVLGEEHPDTLASMSNLAFMHYGQGHYDQAERLYVEGLEIARRTLGEAHPRTLVTMNNLALLYQEQGRFAEAEPLCRLVLEVRRRELGEDHPDTLGSMNNLALLHYGQDRFDAAEPLFAEVLELRRRVLGEEHPATLSSMNNLALLYCRQGRRDQAEPLYVRTLDIRRRALGEEHPQTLISMDNLALLYRDQGRLSEAEPLFARALEVRRRLLGEQHPHTLESLHGLASCLIRAGRFGEAETLARQCYERHCAVYGPEDPQTSPAVKLLIELYDGWGKPDQAAQWRAKLPTPQPSGAPSDP